MLACTQHATDEDRRHQEWFGARLSEEWKQGFRAGRESAQLEHESAVRRAALAAEERARFRLTSSGRQVVCCGRYAYTWGGEPLEIGDRVLLPGNWLVRGPFEDTVTSLGTSYTGALSEVLRKVPTDEPR